MGAFGMARRESYKTQRQDWSGAQAGRSYNVQLAPSERAGYNVLGVLAACGFLYFLVQGRRDNLVNPAPPPSDELRQITHRASRSDHSN